MAGHSKWANIKYRKERADKKKGKLFSRLAKEIISAVKQKGSDMRYNDKLRSVVQKAKAANMPNENIERNIKKATHAGQEEYVEMTYELYGYGGVGIIVEIMTDNKNRIASEIRIATNKKGGTIATPGSVSFNFERLGVIQVEKGKAIEEELFLIATENKARDFDEEQDYYMITTAPESLYRVEEAIVKRGIECLSADLAMIPKILVECTKEDERANNELIEYLENIDDVDAVYHNMDI